MPDSAASPSTDQLLTTHLRRLLAYHGWAYERLIHSLQALDEADYRAPRGLFFGSLHGTLNHLAVADRLWLARVRHEPRPFDSLGAEAATDLPSLGHFIDEGLGAWQAWLSQQNDQSLCQPLAYHSMDGNTHSKPLADLLLHLVNHGTHHRGQISAALTALGQPAPVLDYLYFLPEHL
ncbi:MAG TPA: DinB family protein [Pseudomonas sp.]|nr:DinB family protein [Pseudomonas sp.]